MKKKGLCTMAETFGQRHPVKGGTMKRESLSGLLLIACAVLAMVISNSPFGPVYEYWLHAPLPAGTHLSLLHWINDAVMAVFFFVVGAEVKREFLYGELKSPSAAILPMAAALGGMLVPAAIYSLCNAGLPTAGGWGIPMATDIAFSLGVLSLAAPKAPRSLVVFLTALAIVDDLGGIVVIAVFYAGSLQGPALAGGFVVWLLMLAACRRNWQQPGIYLAGAVLIWLAFFFGGIHPTMAGVLTGFAMPAVPGKDGREGLLFRAEHALTPVSAFVIMPVFALANAGIRLDMSGLAGLASAPGLGILAGLVLGKLIGIGLSVLLLVSLKKASLPAGVTMRHFWSVGLLAGIGFTMSLFIAGLAFPDSPVLMTAKTAIIAASLIAAVLGGFLVNRVSR